MAFFDIVINKKNIQKGISTVSHTFSKSKRYLTGQM